MKRTRTVVMFLLSLLFLHPGVSATGAESRIKGLSQEEKVGQIMMCYFEGPALSANLKRMIGDLKIGGVILYSSRGNIVSTGQVSDLCRNLRS